MQSRSVRQEMGTTVAQQKVHSGTRDVARRLLSHLGMPAEALHAADAIQLEGSKDGPHMPSPFWVTEALAGANLAIAAMLHLIARQRMIDSSLSADAIKVNSEHATNMSHAHFTHEHGGRRYFQAQEVLQSQAGDSAGKDPNLVFNTMFVGHWICKDGRACIFYANVADTPAKILKAVGFPDDETKINKLIALANSTEPEERVEFCRIFGEQIRTWDSKALQEHLTKVRVGTIGVPLTQAEFLESPHGSIARTWPKPLLFAKMPSPEYPISSGVADLFPATPFTRLANASQSGVLHGIKILELTRVVAGPVAGSTLGHFGPDILRVSNPGLQDAYLLSVPMNMNKRLVEIDARSESGMRLLRELILEADVFLENNAFGAMDRLGLGVEDVMKLIAEKRPDRGIVYGRSNAYGFEGPLRAAPGYEHVAQSLSGLTMEQGIDSPYDAPVQGIVPTLVPVNLLDCFTGHSLALGVLAGLYRRSVEGGSYLVQGSLLQSAMFIQTFPRHPRAVVQELWKRYPAWPLEFDGAQIKGTMTHYFRFMADYIRDGTPSSHLPEMFYEIPETPYGVSVRTLSSPIRIPYARQGVKWAPRPFGYDKEARWLRDGDGGDVVEKAGRWIWVGKDKARL